MPSTSTLGRTRTTSTKRHTRRHVAFALAAVAAGVGSALLLHAAIDDPGTARTTSAGSGVPISANAAERWLEHPATLTASPISADAAERRAERTRTDILARCQGLSADAAERCVSVGP